MPPCLSRDFIYGNWFLLPLSLVLHPTPLTPTLTLGQREKRFGATKAQETPLKILGQLGRT